MICFIYSSEALDEHDDCQDTSEKIIIPSEIPYSDEYLIPCGVCGRTFSRSALERHMKICQKVNQTKRRIFEASKLRTKYLDSVPITPVQRRKSTKSEESRPCPHCSRKFGPKVEKIILPFISINNTFLTVISSTSTSSTWERI